MAVVLSEHSSVRASIVQPLWHRTAPRRLVEEIPSGDLHSGWTAWTKHVAHRRRPQVPSFLRGKRPPILWGFPGARLDVPQAVAKVLALPEVPLAVDATESVQTVALAYALVELAGKLSAESWWRLVERLVVVANAVREVPIDWRNDPQALLRHQLLAGELPLALSYLFPEISALHDLRKAARAALSECLIDVTDGHGLPHARLLPVFVPLVACWTRAQWLGTRLKRGCWTPEAQSQYRWLVQHTLRLVDAEARPMLVPHDGGAPPSVPKDLFTTALESVGDSKLCAAAAAVLPSRMIPRRIPHTKRDLPRPSLESDWSGISVLASGWSRSAARLALSFADDPMRIELTVGRTQLFAGDWTCQTTCDGAPVRVVGEWNELCWESDDQFDLMELGVELSDGLRMERQLLLARDERVLYVADIVLTADGAPRRLSHAFRFPLAEGVTWQPESDTRDGVLVAGKGRAAVLPLALHEWRSDPRGGSLNEESRHLVLAQETTGGAICCPLLLDLDPRRIKRERTWRRLTVGESLESVPHDVAVAFRAQAGRDQWLFYRSLAPAGNRTFLGQNIAGEFAAGRFRTSGKFKPWVEIEAC